MNVQCTPDRDGIQVGNAASVLVPDHKIHNHHTVLVRYHTDRKTVSGSLQGIADIAAGNAAASSIELVICHLILLSRRSPVVLDRILVHIRTIPHDFLSLSAQASQYGRIRT